MATTTEQRPLGELFTELASETATLVRHEVQLAKVEMTAKVKSAGYDAAQIAVGGVIAVMGAFALLAAVILGLGTLMPLWVAALVVGLAVSVLGTVLALYGLRAFKRIDPAPRETIRTLQEDKQWLREQVSR